MFFFCKNFIVKVKILRMNFNFLAEQMGIDLDKVTETFNKVKNAVLQLSEYQVELHIQF